MVSGQTIHRVGMGLAGIVLPGSGFLSPPYVPATLAVGVVIWIAAYAGLREGLAAALFGVAVLLPACLRHSLPAPWFFLASAVLLGTGGILGRRTDILRRRYRRLEEARAGMEREKMELATILDFLPDATFAVDSRHRVILWNRAAERMTGVKKEDVLGRASYEHALPFYGSRRPLLADMVLGDSLDPEDSYEKMEKVEDRLLAEGFAPLPGDRGLTFWSAAAPLYGPDGGIAGAVQSIRDIGDRKRTEQELRHFGTHDALTGLYNRAYFQKRMGELDGGGRPVSVIVCDIDCLKLVNDTFGHLKGDELLRRAALLIAGELRSSDCVAKVGGDEFAALLPDTDEQTAQNICVRLGRRVERENLAHPGLMLGISAGSATTRRPGESLAEVFKRADDAMYRQKALRSADKCGRRVPIPDRDDPPGGARVQGKVIPMRSTIDGETLPRLDEGPPGFGAGG